MVFIQANYGDKMIVYKFGGASVADAANIKNVSKIIGNADKKPLVVVVSAMGKTTNALEALLKESRGSGNFQEAMKQLRSTHREILAELFGYAKDIPLLDKYFDQLTSNLLDLLAESYDYAYDQIVSFGELISTSIVEAFLQEIGLESQFVDAREMIITDDTFREGIIDWEATETAVKEKLPSSQNAQIYVTQGFIGSNETGATTTLGREGSDFTAAILSFCLDAEYMAIWKDVPGVLTADPRIFQNVAKIDRLSYREAIEMTYYGAKVIHPKTIKPIQNKNIPLWVKSFKDPGGRFFLCRRRTLE